MQFIDYLKFKNNTMWGASLIGPQFKLCKIVSPYARNLLLTMSSTLRIKKLLGRAFWLSKLEKNKTRILWVRFNEMKQFYYWFFFIFLKWKCDLSFGGCYPAEKEK